MHRGSSLMIFLTSFHVDVKVIFERQVNKKTELTLSAIAPSTHVSSIVNINKVIRMLCFTSLGKAHLAST